MPTTTPEERDRVPAPAVEPLGLWWTLDDGPTQFPCEDDAGADAQPVLLGPWVAASVGLLALVLLVGAALLGGP